MAGLPQQACRDGRVEAAAWLIPRRLRPGVVFYVHGGGFVSCSAATHRPIAAALARLTRRPVFSVDYRLAPEARLPAAHEDVAGRMGGWSAQARIHLRSPSSETRRAGILS
jgi:acetyl esterase/lipase